MNIKDVEPLFVRIQRVAKRRNASGVFQSSADSIQKEEIMITASAEPPLNSGGFVLLILEEATDGSD